MIGSRWKNLLATRRRKQGGGSTRTGGGALEFVAQSIHSITSSQALEPKAARDYSSVPAQAVNIALLHTYLGKMALVTLYILFQLHDVQVEFPSFSSRVETADKNRLWIQTARIFDYCETIKVSIREGRVPNG